MNCKTEMTPKQTELPMMTLTSEEAALRDIGFWLRENGYRFSTITPRSHDRVNRRPENFRARSLADVFGWNRPFVSDLMPLHILQWMENAKVLEKKGEDCFSRVRYSSLFGESLFVHSAFPTTDPDSVFFGPDTYRFAFWVRQNVLPDNKPTARRILEIACGSGAVGILVARYSGVNGGVKVYRMARQKCTTGVDKEEA